jgi:hypothetical protein
MLPETDTKTDFEIVQYLMNFWEHSVNDTLLPKTSNDEIKCNMPEIIRKISKSSPEQIQLHDNDNWYFIQDFYWHPDTEEAMETVCPKLGIQINKADGTLSKNKVFRPIPQNLQELYSAIVEFRVESL